MVMLVIITVLVCYIIWGMPSKSEPVIQEETQQQGSGGNHFENNENNGIHSNVNARSYRKID